MLSRAAVLSDYKVGPDVVDITVPSLKAGEILVEVDAAPVGATDVAIADGLYGSDVALPLIMGREGSGRILETKDRPVDVHGTPLEPGLRIVWTHPWCGQCRSCALDRQPMLCDATRGYGWGPSPLEKLNGTYSEYIIVAPGSKVFAVPDSLDPVLVATATSAVGAVLRAVAQIPRRRFSDRIVVLGSGSMGLYAAAVAVASGASEIHLIGGSEVGLGCISDWGLSTRFDIAHSTPDERRIEITDQSDGRGVDLVIDCIEHREKRPAESRGAEGARLLRQGGTYLAVDHALDAQFAVKASAILNSHQNFISSFSADSADIGESLAFLKSYHERFSLSEMISGHRRYTLDEVKEALGSAHSGLDKGPILMPTR